MRSWRLWIAIGLGAIGALWAASICAKERHCRLELVQAKSEMASGRLIRARQRLANLTHECPGSDEALFQLGLCDEGLGHRDAAEAAWARVSPKSTLARQAGLGRARLLMNAGRMAPAEVLLLGLDRDETPEGRQVRQSLELLFRLQGRVDEVRELILESWEQADDPPGVLRRLYLLDNSAFPIDYVESTLATADSNDDRVWLGKANLAMWTGQLATAAHWLSECSRGRPDDQAVWRAKLEYARQSGDLEAVKQATRQLALNRFSCREVLGLRAWLAARTGNANLEREALQSLTEKEPGNISAWDRLAELSLQAGRKSEADLLHNRKQEFNQTREDYKTLIGRDDRANHAKELARLAGKLGRVVEARGWTLIEQGRAAQESLGSDDQTCCSTLDGNGSLATALGELDSIIAKAPALAAPGRSKTIPRFVDEATSAGLRFIHDNGQIRGRNPPPTEAMCGGAGLLDFDGDGWLDLYVVQGGPFPPPTTSLNSGDRLYHNRRDGTFADVSVQSGIASFPGGYGHGVAVADYDNDGRPDLFITRWRSYALYHNRGDGRFEDVTEKAGLGGARDWPTSAAFADLDGDGDLDLYVCHYLVYDPSNPRRCVHLESPSKHECNPLDFPPLVDHVFRNDAGRFVDVTTRAGFVDANGRGLGVVAADLDDDNRIDLYVANDMTANYLFRNLGAFQFEETGHLAGAAASADGGYKAGMGIARGDLDGDGLLDLAVTNYFGESTTFYRGMGGGYFADHTSNIGMAAPTRRLLGFGIAFFDADLDGNLDVLSANGHVLDSRPRFPWTMPLQLLQGGGPHGVNDVSDRAGEVFSPLHLGRGLAAGDVDNDGRIDAIVVAQNEPLIYLHNQTETRGHFVAFALQGTLSNRDAIGARVTIVAGGARQTADRFGGGSYQSAGDPRLHFGLGNATTVEAVEVRWPSGQVDRHSRLPADREYVLLEGALSPAVRNRERPKKVPSERTDTH
jgi:predicted Zn-dependent protease